MKLKLVLLIIATSLVGCSGSDSHPNRDPGVPTGQGMRGYNYHEDAMQTADGEFRWIQEAVTGYKRPNSKELPSKVSFLDRPNCNIPRKKPHQVAHVAHIASGLRPTSVYHIPNNMLADRAKDFTKFYVERKGDIRSTDTFTTGRQMEIANVVVTESRPSILVLVSQTDVIWNFHISEFANLEQVVVIGRQMTGVSNLPDSVELHAIWGAQAQRCGLNVWRTPKDHWRYVQNVTEGGSSSSDEQLAKDRRNGLTFERWIATHFEATQHEVLGANALGNFLAGPMPVEQKIPYQRFKGASIKISPASNLIVAEQREFKEKSMELVKQAALKAAGGNLKKLIAGN